VVWHGDAEHCVRQRCDAEPDHQHDLLFGLSHPGQWLAAIVCAALYQGLVLKLGRIGDAMVAHGVTNGLISAYAISTGHWQFT
jgi:hypothetical protein